MQVLIHTSFDYIKCEAVKLLLQNKQKKIMWPAYQYSRAASSSHASELFGSVTLPSSSNLNPNTNKLIYQRLIYKPKNKQ
jgi:hypothetical protein